MEGYLVVVITHPDVYGGTVYPEKPLMNSSQLLVETRPFSCIVEAEKYAREINKNWERIAQIVNLKEVCK